MNTSAVVADQLREASFVKREAFSLRIRTSHDYSPRFTFHASRGTRLLTLLVQYCRLSIAMTSLSPDLQARSSVDRMGPIRDARPGNFAGMHAIGEVFGQNNPGTDAGKCGG